MTRQMGLVGLLIAAMGLWSAGRLVQAEEHGGQEHAGHEHGGQEHGGTAHEHGGSAAGVEPSAEQIRQTIETYVSDIVAEDGAFEIEDEVTDDTRTLEFVRVHERVGKTGDLYYSCTDMRDTASGELLDLDFDVEADEDGELEIIDVRIHKVGGQPRYTYDEHDNRIPLTAEGVESAPSP